MDYIKGVCVLYSFVRFFAFGWKGITQYGQKEWFA